MKWVFSWVPLAIVLMAGADVPAGLHAQEAPMGSFTLAAPSLSTLVDAALARDPAQELTPVLEREAEALARRSRSWISGAPVIAAHWQDDALSSDAGLREGEVGLDLPLWWPNARRAARLLTEASAGEAKLRPRYNRWQAAGVIRERLWALAMAQVNLAQAQDAERSSISLHEQVLARVQAGDLAQTDQLMSEQEMLARQAERQLAEREWARSAPASASCLAWSRTSAHYSQNPSHASRWRTTPAWHCWLRKRVVLRRSGLSLWPKAPEPPFYKSAVAASAAIARKMR